MDIEAEVDTEIATHFEYKIEALVARGMSPEAAREEAQRQFGDLRAARRELIRTGLGQATVSARREWRGDWMMDLRNAVRGLVRTPGLTAAVLTMLGLGIGGAAAMYGLLDRLLLRVGRHVSAPDELRRLYVREFSPWSPRERTFSASHAEPLLRRVAASLPTGTAVAIETAWRDRLGHGGPRVPVGLVSGDVSRVLGTVMQLGRPIEPSDDVHAAPPVAVISDAFWRRQYTRDPSVLGRTVEVGRTRFTIVGIAPRGFSGIRPDRVDIWVPVTVGGDALMGPRWRESNHVFEAIIRLPEGVDTAAMVASVQRLYRAEAATRRGGDTGAVVSFSPVAPWKRPGAIRESARLALIVGGVASILCLIAVANATNLLLLRALQRRRETAVRLALGAGRARIIRGVLIESTLLAAGGAIAAAIVAGWGGELLRKLIVEDDWQAGIRDARVMAFAGGLALLIAVVTGLVPGWLSTRPEAIAALKAGMRAGIIRSRIRGGLLVFQAALTVVLMCGLALYVRSFLKARGEDYVVAADRIVNVSVSPSRADSLDAPGLVASMTEELARSARLIPGVVGVAQASITPIYGYGGAPLRVEGVDSVEWSQHGPFMTEIDTAFLGVTGIPLQRGRAFTAADVESAAPVALVNDAFAKKMWPGQEAIGKCLYVGGTSELGAASCRQVVGVVSSYRNRIGEEERMQQYYLPLSYHWHQGRGASHSLVVRTSGDPTASVPALYHLLRQRLPSSEPDEVMAISEIRDRDLAPWRSGTTLFGLFSGLAIVLAVGGLYSVVACSVAQRSHEFGIRIAVGARPRNLVMLVLKSALRPVAVGLAIGIVLSLWLVRFLAELLYQTSPRDPLSFAAAAAIMLLAAGIACLVPARTALRVDPRESLQAD